MNVTDVSSPVLYRLRSEWEDLTPQARKAARYVLGHPLDVGVSTVRAIADAAKVNPNTFVRMARQIEFNGYEDFRAPFREAIRKGSATFPDRARWLQDAGKAGQLGHLYAAMAQAALVNLEETFAGISPERLADAARAVWSAQSVYVLGVGVNNANARNFTYLASTGMTRFHAIPRTGSTAVDDLAWAGPNDVLIAMTSRPYRAEVVEAVATAREQGLTIIALSDSPASPIARDADHAFTVATDTPQIFPPPSRWSRCWKRCSASSWPGHRTRSPVGSNAFTNAAMCLASTARMRDVRAILGVPLLHKPGTL